MNRSRIAILSALLWIALSALIVQSYTLSVWAKALTGFFAYGRSFWQLYFFLGWSSLLFLVVTFFPARAPGRRVSFTIACVLAFCALLNVSGHIYVASLSELPLHEPIFASSSGAVSKSSINHIHTSKAALSWMETLALGKPRIGFYDSGFPYYRLFPGWFLALITLSVGLLTWVLIDGARRIVHLRKEDEWFGALAVYTVTSFTLLKLSIDGGYLNIAGASSLAILLIILSVPGSVKNSRYSLSIVARYFISGGIGGLVGYFCVVYLAVKSDQYGSAIRADLFAPILFLVALHSGSQLLYYLSTSHHPNQNSSNLSRPQLFTLLVASFMGLLLLLPMLPWARTDARLQVYAFDTKRQVNILNYLRDSSKLNQCDGALCLAQITAQAHQTLSSLYEEYKLRPGLRFHRVPEVDCNPELNIELSAELKLLNGEIAPATLHGKILPYLNLTSCEPAEWCDLKIGAVFPACTPIQTESQAVVINALGLLGESIFVYRNEALRFVH